MTLVGALAAAAGNQTATNLFFLNLYINVYIFIIMTGCRMNLSTVLLSPGENGAEWL